MTEAHKLALVGQKKRLEELIEVSGKYDPHHPLQLYSIRRIVWLELQIEKEKRA